MSNMFEKAVNMLNEEIGQDKIMVLATRKGEGVAARTVNVYSYDNCFYFITESDSNKYKQITQNASVALSVDAIQIEGRAVALEHPYDSSNSKFAQFVENLLPRQLAKYSDAPMMRLIQVIPSSASFILLTSGEGFSIHYLQQTANGILHDLG